MGAALESLRTELASVVGEFRVLSDPQVCADAAVDGVTPGAVVYPADAEQVAEVLKYAADHDLAVIPFRNGTKLGIGNPPRRYDLALSLKDLNRVWHYEPADLTLTVESGMKFGDLQHFLARHGLWLPLDPVGGPRASIGGILAANSAGPLRTRYGTSRDMVLGMKIATTEGKLVNTGGRVVKNVAGYDLAKLLIGSYGTLGVIVEASFKLFPLPAARSTFVVSAAKLDAVREFRRRLLASPLGPMRVSLLDAAASLLVRASTAFEAKAGELAAFEVWVEAGGSRRVIERTAGDLEQLAASSRAGVSSLAGVEVDEAWGRIADFQTWLPANFPDTMVLKAALPISRTEDWISRARELGEGEKLWLATFADPGVGVVRLCLRAHRDASDLRPLTARLRSEAESLGGALVVERCPLALKLNLEVWGASGDDFEVMRKVKSAWDPKGVLAPGRFVGRL